MKTIHLTLTLLLACFLIACEANNIEKGTTPPDTNLIDFSKSDLGISCDQFYEWSSGIDYAIGDKVTYRGDLFEKTSSGWRYIGTCSNGGNGGNNGGNGGNNGGNGGDNGGNGGNNGGNGGDNGGNGGNNGGNGGDNGGNGGNNGGNGGDNGGNGGNGGK
ncbi:hypothetical protein [Aquimarina longa]|uniref:hypothetical protein n=1 Tax=Aquimarina longa TaxID=1080221 RepID=UPI0007838B4A|nr:hypothetical protein [Aquimarina longa]